MVRPLKTDLINAIYFKMVLCNMIEIIQSKCTQCGLCKEVCPCEAVQCDENDVYTIDMSLCVECDVCIEECPALAIEFKAV